MCRAAGNLLQAGFRYSIRLQDVTVGANEFLDDAYLRNARTIMENVRSAGGRPFSQRDLLLAERRLFPHEATVVEHSNPADTWFLTFHTTGDLGETMLRTDNIRTLLPFPLEYFCATCSQNTQHVHAVMTTRFPGDVEWMRRVIEQRLHQYGLAGVRFTISPLQKPTKASLLYIYRQSVGKVIHWNARDIVPTLENKRNSLGPYSLGALARPRYDKVEEAISDGCSPALISVYDPHSLLVHKAAVFDNRACYNNMCYEVPMVVAPISQRETLLRAMERRLPEGGARFFVHTHASDGSNADRYLLQPFTEDYIHSEDPQQVLEEAERFATSDEYEATASKILFVDEGMIDAVEWPEGVAIAEDADSVFQTINYLFDSL
jgi:ribosomal protein L44E